MRLRWTDYCAHIWPVMGAAAAFAFVGAVLVYDRTGGLGHVFAEGTHHVARLLSW